MVGALGCAEDLSAPSRLRLRVWPGFMLNVNLLTVNCSMFGRWCDSFLSHFPAYAVSGILN